MKNIHHNLVRKLLVFLFLSLLWGCLGSSQEQRLAERLVQQEDWDKAVAAYRVALQKDPFNQDLEKAYEQVKTRAAETHFAKGREFLKEKRLPEALQEFQIALALNPRQPQHRLALGDAVRLKDAQTAFSDGEKLRRLGRHDEALTAYERAIELDPGLMKALDGITAIMGAQQSSKNIGGTAEPVTLRFQNTRLKQVFEILARTANINIIFEKDVRDDLVTIFTKDLPFNEALNLILTTNQLFARRVAPDTLLIIPDTKQKRQQFEDLMIRTFYLSNAKAKDMANLLRTILETKRVYVNEPLNTVVLRDEPDKLLLAEHVILANDRRDSEVVFDIEILEVNRTKTKKLGANLANQAGAGVFPPSGGTIGNAANFTYQQLTSLDPNSYLFTIPSSILFNFFKTESDAKTLASPQLRVLNNQKASINIGDKQPILLSTTNVLPGQAATGAVPTTSTVTSIEFKDTGVKLNIEPIIHLTGEITIKLKIEITRLGDKVILQASPEISQYRFGTRVADTTLNLKDGETVILAGLISEEDRKTSQTIPWLDSIPIIKDLFFKQTDKITTEVILSITPRIVRSVTTPSLVKQTLWSGTADQYSTIPLFSPPQKTALTLQEEDLALKRLEDQSPSGNSTAPQDPSSTPNAPNSPSGAPSSPPQLSGIAAKILVSPAQVTTRVGQTVRVAVMGDSMPEINKAGFSITYDPAIIDFNQALLGDMWGEQDREANLTVSAAPQKGQVVLQVGGPSKVIQGHGPLVTLIFTAKATGQSPIVIRQPSLSRVSQGSIPITAQHGVIRVL